MSRTVRFARYLSFLIIPGIFSASLTAGAVTTNVSYGSFFFSPKVVKINVGDTVCWCSGGAGHTLRGTGSDPICSGASLPCSHTFNSAGNFAYECTVSGHAALGMTGLVMVVKPPPSPALLTNMMRLPNGQFQFKIVTTANHTNIVQASTNLSFASNWISINTDRKSVV